MWHFCRFNDDVKAWVGRRWNYFPAGATLSISWWLGSGGQLDVCQISHSLTCFYMCFAFLSLSFGTFASPAAVWFISPPSLHLKSPTAKITHAISLLFSSSLSPSSSSSSSVAALGEQTVWSKAGTGDDVSSLRQSLRGTFTIPWALLSLP